MTDLPFHPIADLFPLIEGDDFDRLVADIKANGLQEMIVLLDGAILDGRNRYRALRAVGIDIARHTIEFSELAFTRAAPRDPLAWVLSKNLHRRHLSESQRAMVAARLETFGHGGHRDTPADFQDADLHLGRKQVAELMNVSPRSVASASKVASHGAPELADAVNKGDLAVSAAVDLTDLPVARQTEIIRNADPAALYTVIKEARAKKQAEKKDRRADREQSLAVRQMALPDKRYGVIYADPEWRFEPYSRETGMDRAADNHYPTSDLADIKARDVVAIAAEDCVLFLWATAPMLPQALDVMANWGFAYKSHTIWRKAEVSPAAMNTDKRDRGGYSGALMLGTGYWFRNGHELLLVGTRGKAVAPAMGDQFPSVIDWPALRHSEKPERFAELIETYFPNLPKIELNARAARPGWDAWGLEAPDMESEAEHDGTSSGPGARPADESAPPDPVAKAEEGATAEDSGAPVDTAGRPDAGRSASATSEQMDVTSPGGENPAPDLNAAIRDGYAQNLPLADIALATGLSPNAVKQRAKRMQLGDPERQKAAARKLMTEMNAARGGDQ